MSENYVRLFIENFYSEKKHLLLGTGTKNEIFRILAIILIFDISTSEGLKIIILLNRDGSRIFSRGEGADFQKIFKKYCRPIF